MKSHYKFKFCYNKLWKLLIDKNMKRGKLRELSGLSTATFAKLSRGANVHTDVLLALCEALNCGLSDILELVPNNNAPTTE